MSVQSSASGQKSVTQLLGGRKHPAQLKQQALFHFPKKAAEVRLTWRTPWLLAILIIVVRVDSSRRPDPPFSSKQPSSGFVNKVFVCFRSATNHREPWLKK
jgi:hypothetical protein